MRGLEKHQGSVQVSDFGEEFLPLFFPAGKETQEEKTL
ncbi:hypothetical protein TDIS_0289 [Thermosulfurimonas dismutans]|uniref:Uncharacterized protein n=1 Tax=Thermosulfurimonas dismutans TaxID=999894 RepID=A0A179D7L7_9BACT|nr:hypothetical protein TDIS_0289 [Thermosulfurimonas dismutans]